MVFLTQVARYATLGLIAGYALLIGWKLYLGEIPLRGLLESGKGRSSPARLQMLLFTLGVAVQYVASVWKNPRTDSLPAISPQVLAILAGSQAVYLGGKALSVYLPLLKKLR
jgi:hypothetical protein